MCCASLQAGGLLCGTCNASLQVMVVQDGPGISELLLPSPPTLPYAGRRGQDGPFIHACAFCFTHACCISRMRLLLSNFGSSLLIQHTLSISTGGLVRFTVRGGLNASEGQSWSVTLVPEFDTSSTLTAASSAAVSAALAAAVPCQGPTPVTTADGTQAVECVVGAPFPDGNYLVAALVGSIMYVLPAPAVQVAFAISGVNPQVGRIGGGTFLNITGALMVLVVSHTHGAALANWHGRCDDRCELAGLAGLRNQALNPNKIFPQDLASHKLAGPPATAASLPSSVSRFQHRSRQTAISCAMCPKLRPTAPALDARHGRTSLRTRALMTPELKPSRRYQRHQGAHAYM